MSKLGLHLLSGYDPAAVIAARPRLIVLPGDAPALAELHAGLGDSTLFITGVPLPTVDWVTFWDGPAGQDVERALDLWWAAAEPLLDAAPFAYWMGFQGMRQRRLAEPYLAFETARVRRLAGLGYRACAANLATGLPDPRDAAWAGFPALCQAVADHGGLLGLQEFAPLYLWAGYGSNEWLGDGFRAERKFPAEYEAGGEFCLHYREVVQDMLAPAGLGGLPIVITACGLGSVGAEISQALSADGQPTGGWRTCATTWRRRDGEQNPADYTLRQLRWYAAQIGRDPAVQGAAVYAWGSGDDHDLAEPLGERLLASLAVDDDVALPPEPAPARPASNLASGAPSAGPAYYLVTSHPEVFDALWREAQTAAETRRAVLHWRQVQGRFVIQTGDAALWQRLYQLGQMLAQMLDTDLEGGEGNPLAKSPN